MLGMRNPILGMASHDLCNAKTIILGETPRAIPGIDGNPHGRLPFAHAFSEEFFKSWGGPRAPDLSQILCKGLTLVFPDLCSGLFP